MERACTRDRGRGGAAPAARPGSCPSYDGWYLQPRADDTGHILYRDVGTFYSPASILVRVALARQGVGDRSANRARGHDVARRCSRTSARGASRLRLSPSPAVLYALARAVAQGVLRLLRSLSCARAAQIEAPRCCGSRRSARGPPRVRHASGSRVMELGSQPCAVFPASGRRVWTRRGACWSRRSWTRRGRRGVRGPRIATAADYAAKGGCPI